MGGTVTLGSLLGGQAGPPPVTLDKSTLQPVAPVTFDKRTLAPINPTDQQRLSRTLGNMTAAMSGQPMPNPQDQGSFDSGKQAGMESAAVQTAVGAGMGALGASSVVRAAGPLVPAGRDAAGKFLPWVASQVTQEGPSLAKAGVQAAMDFSSAHPIAAKALASALGTMGAGTALHFLKYIGNPNP